MVGIQSSLRIASFSIHNTQKERKLQVTEQKLLSPLELFEKDVGRSCP